MKTLITIVKTLVITALFYSCTSSQNQVSMEKYKLEGLPLIGTFNNMEFYEGGISGMIYIPGTNMEFYLINDRGPNLVMNEHPLANGENVKLFAFPDYSPKIFHTKLKDGNFYVKNVIPIKKPDGTTVSGLPFPGSSEEHQETAWYDLEGSIAGTDLWGFDFEAIALGNNNDLWVAEEYRTSVLNIDRKTGEIIAIYGPELINEHYQPIDTIFKYRRPNRGFESVAVTPEGKVFAMLQSPMWNPTEEVGEVSRLVRILELNPKTGNTQMYLHEIPGAKNEIRIRDWKIADMTAINNHEFLVLEHATQGSESLMDVYKIDIRKATPISSEMFNGKTPEQLINAENAREHGIEVVGKTHVLDLIANGYDSFFDKPEGLTIIDAKTIAIINDNDYDADAPYKNAYIEQPGMETYLFVFTLTDKLY